MSFKLFCNVKEDGSIIKSIFGEEVVGGDDFQYQFTLENVTKEYLIVNIPRFRIIDGNLTLNDLQVNNL